MTLSPTLRLLLLEQEDGPDYPEYQAAAGVLSDLTKVLDQGLQHDVGMEQMQRKYNALSAQKAGGKAPRNKLEAKKAAQAVNERLSQVK